MRKAFSLSLILSVCSFACNTDRAEKDPSALPNYSASEATTERNILAAVDSGEFLFKIHCAKCHLAPLRDGPYGPGLRSCIKNLHPDSLHVLREFIANSNRRRNGAGICGGIKEERSFEHRFEISLTDKNIEEIAGYVWELSQQ
jgi:hypothetical protein